MQETQVRLLGQEDPLKKGMATTPVFLLENSMDRGGWRTIVHGVVEPATTERLSTLNTQTTLIYSLSNLCPTYTSSCHIQWGCPGSCEGLPEVLNLQKKKGNSLHTLFLPLVSVSSYDWCQTPEGLKWDKSNARLRRRLENNCKVLLIISLRGRQMHRNKFGTY